MKVIARRRTIGYRTNTPMASQRTQIVSNVTGSLCCLVPLVI